MKRALKALLTLVTSVTLVTLVMVSAAQAPAHADPALAAAVAGSHRTPAFVARDGWRHPIETLSFFGIQPQMAVVEISPGGGWYTEILAPYLRDKGQLTLAADDPQSGVAYYRRSAERLAAKLAVQPGLYDRVRLLPFEVPVKTNLGAPASADLVLTFRNVHNWVAQGDDAVLQVFKSAHAVLKPGGVLGVVDHRRPADQVQDAKASSGYVHVAYVTRLALAAGLRLAASSEINANPKDTANHPGGVWALPPSYGNKDQDRATLKP